MHEARARTPMLVAAGLLLVGAVGLIASHRCSVEPTRPPAGRRADAGLPTPRPRAPEVAGAVVLIAAAVFEVPPESAGDAEVSGIVDPLADRRASAIDGAAADSLTASLRSLAASGKIAVLSEPRVAVGSGESASVSLAQVPGPTGTSVVFELTAAYTPVAREDGTIDLESVFRAKRVEGEVATVLDNLGLPAGDRMSAAAVLTVAQGGGAVWTRPLGDSTVVVVVRPRLGG